MKKIIPLLLFFIITDGVLCQFNRQKIYDSPFYGLSGFFTGNVNSSSNKIIYIMLGLNYENPNESGMVLRLNKTSGNWTVPSNGFLNPYWCYGAVPPNPPSYHCNFVREFKASPRDTGFVIKNSEIFCGGYESGNQFFVTYNSGIDTSIIQQFSQDMFGQPCVGFDINPVNDSIIYICYIRPSAPGLAFVYKSTNRGMSWFTTDSMLTYSSLTSFLKISPFNPSYIYISGSSNYVSTNAGNNFIQLSTPVFKDMYFDNTDNSIYALGFADSSLYKSTNSGFNWTWLHTFSERPSGFEISPDNHTILYAGTRKGLYRSINSGLSWSLYNNSFSPSKNVIGISKDPGTGESLYVCTSDAVYKVWGEYIQSADTSSLQLMPLAIGNTWTYEVSSTWPPPFGTHYMYKSIITKDTVINGKRFFFSTSDGSSGSWIRVDSVSGDYVKYVTGFECILNSGEMTIDSLYSKLGDTAATCFEYSTDKRVCQDTSSINIWGLTRKSKLFNWPWGPGMTIRQYIKGIGFYYSNFGEIDPQLTYLRGCVINGIVYGDTALYQKVSGFVTYSDNNQPVQSGYVKALKYDWEHDEVITVDSTVINYNGYYTLPRCTRDSLDIMAYSDDEEDFIPTYHDTTIYWQYSHTIYPSENLDSINIKVRRINNTNPGNYSISGGVYSALMIPNDALKDAVLYAKYNGEYKKCNITIANGYYIVDSLPSGICELVADRIGYYSDYRTLQVGQSTLDTINFFLTRVMGIINKSSSSIPTSFKLYQNYPNPFNPMTTLKIDVPPIHLNPPARSGGKGVSVKLIVYDIVGREVVTLLNIDLQPGTYSITWDASNYASGLYFYKLITDEFVQTKKMVLLK